MTKKSSLQTRLMKLLPHSKSLVVDRNSQLVYEIVCAIDDICNGKKGGQSKRHQMLALFVVSSALKEAKNLFVTRLEAEENLPRLQKTFPEFTYDLKALFAPITEGLSGLFSSIPRFSRWQAKADLLSDLESLGSLLEKSTFIVQAMSLVRESTYGLNEVKKYPVGFAYLRELANIVQIAASGQPLPEMKLGQKGSVTERKEIVTAIQRFSVDKQVQKQYSELKNALEEILADIQDFLVDYPTSEIRTAGFKRLCSSCRKYVAV